VDGYAEHDATALAALVASREVTPEALLDAALARAERVNPTLNALTLLRPEAARRAIAAGLPEGPFRGVPFLLKDLGAEARGFPSNLGSRLFADTEYDYDSEMWLRMRATGVVAFGRTTTPEGGIGPATEAAVYGGPTRNPWNPGRTAGGSSGGSAAAVAAGIVPMAHGSDGGGSIRIPASCCGLFGFKATRARFPDGPASGEGWAGMAIEGVLSRSVRDSAAMMDACAGPDLGAPYPPPPMEEGYVAASHRPPGRLRIGVCDTSFEGRAIHPDCAEAVRRAADLLEDLGHDLVSLVPEADHAGMMRAWTGIVACGAALSVRRRLARLGRDLRPDDVEGVTRGAIRYAGGIDGAAYLDAVETAHAYGRQMARAMAGVDVLLSATLAEPPAAIGRFDHRTEDYEAFRMGPDGVFAYSPFTAAFNASGQPAMSLPLHWTAEGLPIGLHLAAGFGADATLMSLAAQLEAARPWAGRRPPIG
jgi:amidase/6-aminohexanoate-cyclic-dimer hydrolase